MQTCKSISTISYNSLPFLRSVLDNLIRLHVIDFYMYIHHIGEVDLFGEEEKEHTHLFVIPNRRINTSDLGDEFKEIDPHFDKPLKCITWNVSNFVARYFASCKAYKIQSSDFETFQVIHFKGLSKCGSISLCGHRLDAGGLDFYRAVSF